MPEEGQPGLSSRVKERANWWVRREGWFRWSAYPLGGSEPRDHVWFPVSALVPQKRWLGFGLFVS